MVHRINIFLLSILLVVSQFVLMHRAFAANLGGWSLGGGVAQGASIVYNGSKQVILNGASKLATGVAKITPPPSSVAKALAGGAGAIALDLAIQELLGGVDYVLDPANNRVTYTKKPDINDPSDPAYGQYLYGMGFGEFPSPNQACQSYANAWASSSFQYQFVSASDAGCTISGIFNRSRSNYTYGWTSRRLNPAYNPPAEGENENRTKHLPLETVAQQVISNAAAGNAAAQQAVKAAADSIVAEAETDSTKARPIINQLEASQSIPTDQTATGETVPKDQTGENTKGSDLSLDFPVFCSWAPTVCLAANVVINFPNTLTDWWTTANTKADSWANSISTAWTEFKDWMTKEDIPEEATDVDIDQTVPIVPNTSYLNWGAYCPFNPGSQTISLENTSAGLDYDLTSWCELASDLRPFVLAAGALMSFLIASGVIMGRND